MTDQPTATPLSQSVELQLTGQPDVNYKYGSGRIRPGHVAFYYLTDRTNAHLYGSWVRDDGELTDEPVDQLYRHDDDWPDWLAALARQHAPTTPQPPADRAAVRDNLLRAIDPAYANGVLGYQTPEALLAAYDTTQTDVDQAAEAPLSPDYQHPACGFHWHGRDGMDIPMQDGQPVCPRCELAKVRKLLDYTQRRRDEVGKECKRRGKTVLEHSEKIRALEREIDDARRQLGVEILRANQAEAVLPAPADDAEERIEQAEADAELHARNTLTVANERESYRKAWKDEQQRRVKAEAAVARVRRLHDNLDAETDLTSPDDEITRGAAARKIAAALDGWTDPAELRRMADETQPAERVKHSGPDTKFCVLCLSGEHERVADEAQPAEHVYLSTGCLHGDMTLPDGRTGHDYCQSMTGMNGAKRPNSCKFCAAPCQCPCHANGEES